MDEFNNDGTFTPGLSDINVSLKEIRNKILPSHSNEECNKYIEHGKYLKKLYVLTCKWRQDEEKDLKLAKKS